MRIIFMGTPAFAVASLDALITNGFEIVAVVTAPDKPAGRGQLLHESEVKKYAVSKGIPVLQPVKLKDEGFINELRSFKADLQIVVAFRMLPEIVWNMPPLGTYNLHGSLLPKYRGAAPINWAVINGENETGVTTFKLKHEVDTGNILFREKINISENATAGEVHDALMNAGAKLLVKTVQEIEKSVKDKTELKFIAQDDSEVSHAPKIFRDTCRINWDMPAKKIHDLIRGLSPYPAAFTTLQSGAGAPKTLKIYKTNYTNDKSGLTNGSVLTDGSDYLKVCCGEGTVEVLELQLEGKKRMGVRDFLKGFKFENEKRFI